MAVFEWDAFEARFGLLYKCTQVRQGRLKISIVSFVTEKKYLRENMLRSRFEEGKTFSICIACKEKFEKKREIENEFVNYFGIN